MITSGRNGRTRAQAAINPNRPVSLRIKSVSFCETTPLMNPSLATSRSALSATSLSLCCEYP